MAKQVKHKCDWKGCDKDKARQITIFKQVTSTSKYHNFGSPYLCSTHRRDVIDFLVSKIDYEFKIGEPS